MVDSLHFGSATVRLSYSHGHVTIPHLRPLFDAFRQFGPPGEAIADRYDDRGRLIRFLDASASYEPGDWFAMGEWGRVITQSIYNDRTGWYISGGYRFRQVTPYVNYGELNANKNISDPGLSVAGLPPAVFATLSKSQIADIFLGQATRFPDGEPTLPIDQAEGSSARDDFYEKLTASPRRRPSLWSARGAACPMCESSGPPRPEDQLELSRTMCAFFLQNLAPSEY